MRGRLRRLQKRLRRNLIRIPLEDGRVEEFPKAALPTAFLRSMAALSSAGETVEPHPLNRAAATSTDPNWRNSFFAGPGTVVDEEGASISAPRDLSE